MLLGIIGVINLLLCIFSLVGFFVMIGLAIFRKTRPTSGLLAIWISYSLGLQLILGCLPISAAYIGPIATFFLFFTGAGPVFVTIVYALANSDNVLLMILIGAVVIMYALHVFAGYMLKDEMAKV
jgi:hypothetical protein